MADELSPKAPTGAIVTDAILQQAQYAQWRTVTAFTGMRDPTSIWATMVRQDSFAIPIYRELEDKDDDISSALDELKLSVLEREWTLTPGDETQAALDACNEMKAQFALFDLESSFDAMLDAAPYGFTVQELMFDTSAGQARLVSIDDCPQELFRFAPVFQPQVGQLQLLQSVGAGSGDPVAEEKFLIFGYRGRSRSRMGRPILQRCFWPSWIKRQILGFWLKAGEKANGMAIVDYEEGAAESERQLALSIAEALAEGVAFGKPANMNVNPDLLKAAQGGNTTVYKDLFKEMQYSISRAIKGETLTAMGSEGGHGSHTQGKTHQETFDKRSISLAKKHARVINTQLIPRLTLWNFGPAVPPPIFGWDIEEEQDLVQKSTLIGNAQRLGIPIPQAWAAGQLQIPALGEGDVVLVPNVNAPSQPTPATAFSEPDAAAKHQVSVDMADLDLLAAQLKESSTDLFRHRIREIADAANHGSK